MEIVSPFTSQTHKWAIQVWTILKTLFMVFSPCVFFILFLASIRIVLAFKTKKQRFDLNFSHFVCKRNIIQFIKTHARLLDGSLTPWFLSLAFIRIRFVQIYKTVITVSGIASENFFAINVRLLLKLLREGEKKTTILCVQK